MPEQRDDPRRHGDTLEEVIRPKPDAGGDAASERATGIDRQTPTPGSAEGERDVDNQDK